MKKIFAVLCLSLLSNISSAQAISDKIKAAYNIFTKDSQLKYATTSLIVTDKVTGKVLFAHNENVGLAPASTLKTVTSATALAILGEDYRFKTEILYTGNLSGGILNGNILVKGNGDPSLGSNRFPETKKETILNQVLSVVKALGINRINGDVIVDDAVWDSQNLPEGWVWQDMGNYYGAGTSAVCWGENEFELKFKPSVPGGKVELMEDAFVYPFLKIINELETGAAGTGDKVYGYSAPYAQEVYLRGSYAVNLKKAIRFSLPDPALAMAYELNNTLRKNNVAINGYTTTRNLKKENQKYTFEGKNITTIYSPKLIDLVYPFNQNSLNLYGEQMLRAMAAKDGNTIKDGLNVLKDFWEKRDVDKNTLNIGDGSGLSPANRVTAASMIKVLLWATQQSWYNGFLASLPLYNDMKMKSGTIGDVLAYSGYHKNYCFTIMVNNYNGTTSSMRQKMFTLLNSLK